MENKSNIYTKIFFSVLIVAIIFYIAWYFFVQNGQFKTSDFQYISFSNNFSVDIPDNFLADDFSNAEAVVLYDKNKKINANDLKDLLLNDAILIQSFAPLDQNNELFEKYIRQQYKSNDNADVDITFDKNNKTDIATLKIQNKSTNELSEYIKIINLENPIIIDASKDSETMDTMLKSASNINTNKNLTTIKNKLIFIGTLLKAQMASEIRNIFTEDYKEKISDSRFSEIIKNSQQMLQKQINLNGGVLNNKDNEFTCKIIFADPLQTGKNYLGEVTLKKIKGQWQIASIDLPEDDLLKSQNNEE